MLFICFSSYELQYSLLRFTFFLEPSCLKPDFSSFHFAFLTVSNLAVDLGVTSEPLSRTMFSDVQHIPTRGPFSVFHNSLKPS